MPTTGRFIVIEGGDGTGKSRLAAAIAAALRSNGRTVVETREPGGTPLGERIREAILSEASTATTELLLFEAARSHLIEQVIRPALDRGDDVICDRFTGSTVAYQCYGRALDRRIVDSLNAVATGGVSAAVTILLDLPYGEAMKRRAGAGGANRFDNEARDFHERVRAGFLELAAAEGWTVIDASMPSEAVERAALASIANHAAG